VELEPPLSGAASYITGSHNFKVGFNNAYLHHENTTYTDPSAPYSYTFANGARPCHLSNRTSNGQAQRRLRLRVFAQDRWTVGRWTLQGGIRYDAFANSYPEQALTPTPSRPTLNIRFDEIDNLKWKDITPKMGATYDLFGTGRTALKVTLNKYLEGMGTTGPAASQRVRRAEPDQRLNTQTTRPWTDKEPTGNRGDFTPQCDLQDYAANGECGALLNPASFGTI
jgi:outer membrane receptor for monomeric catechols